MANFYNPQWQSVMAIDDNLFDLMAESYFEPTHTGGGCTAWRRDIDVDKDEYVLITNDVEIGEWADRDNPEWEIGHYKDGEFIEGVGELTLAQALKQVEQCWQAAIKRQVDEKMTHRMAISTLIASVERTFADGDMPDEVAQAIRTLVDDDE